MQRCSRCKLALACDAKCFRADWPLHKANCADPEMAKAEAESQDTKDINLGELKKDVMAILPDILNRTPGWTERRDP